MCISIRASINSFLISTLSSIALIFFGNKELYAYNLIIVGIFIFVSLMQLIDLGMWVDLDCKFGTNKIASILGPALNWFQPTAIFIIIYLVTRYTSAGRKLDNNNNKQSLNKKYPILNQFDISSDKFNLIKLLNTVYAIVVVLLLALYYKKAYANPSLLCSGVKDGHLSWNWNTKLNTFYIRIIWHITLINLLSINFKSPFILFTIGLIYMFLFTSIAYKTSVAEVWCYLVNCVPLIMLILQKVFPRLMSRYLQ